MTADLPRWTLDAAERICELEPLREGVIVRDDPQEVVTAIARIIATEHDDQHRRVAKAGR